MLTCPKDPENKGLKLLSNCTSLLEMSPGIVFHFCFCFSHGKEGFEIQAWKDFDSKSHKV